MYNYYTQNYLGKTIHIVKALSDSTHDVQLSLMAEKYDTADPLKVASDFGDGYLESTGWTRVATMNGGIFNGVFANGIEVAFWGIHENDDTSLDGVMGVGHDGNYSSILTFATQSVLKSMIGSFRGAVTGAFGLIIDGIENKGNYTTQGQFSSPSGRAILAQGWDGSILFIAVAGVTGSSGLTGAQCVTLVRDELGLRNAVCMDGGGSTSLIYEYSWKVSTTRQVKNVWGLYVRQKSSDPGGGGGETPTTTRKNDFYIPMFRETVVHKTYVNGSLSKIKDIQMMRDGQLVSIVDAKSI